MDTKHFFNLAIRYQKEKNFDKAILEYEKILVLNPKHSDTIFNLASLYSLKKNYLKASNLLSKYIKFNTDDFNAINNLGLIFFQMGKTQKAIEYLKKSILLNPNYADAYNNIGLIYMKINQYETAEKYCLKSYDLNPKSYATYINLKKILKINGKINDLENLYKNTIKSNPRYINAYMDLMDLYERRNEDKKLYEIIKKAEINFVENDFVNLFKGKNYFKNEKYSKVISLLENLSFKLDTLEQSRCLVLAKSYDKENNTEESYKYFIKMNELSLRNKKKNIDKNNFLNLIDERTKHFQKLNTQKSLEFKDNYDINNPVFMIGFPRSGTTLLDTILRSHPLIEVIEEKPLIHEVLLELKNVTRRDFTNIKDLNLKEIETVRKNYFTKRLKYIKKENKNKIYIDKFPLNIIYSAEIFRIFPNAKFVLSLRNPYDCILSCFMQDFILNDAMANFLSVKDTSVVYDKVMKLWNQYLNIFQIQHHAIKYEDLVENFDSTTKKILEFLNLDWSDSISKYQETAKKRDLISTPSYNQVIKPIYKEAVNRWKRYDSKIQDIKPLIDPWLKKYKYS